MQKIFLYAHAMWAVGDKAPVLTKTVRAVLYAHLQKWAEEKGIRLLTVNGGVDHIHVLVNLHPAQNLAQVVRQLRSESAEWLNATKLVTEPFAWEDEYAAYTVSPNVIRQVTDYLERQDEYHKTRSLADEMEVFEKLQSGQ
ncbi:MAG: IS200/IS605 family transposase [Chitinophagaceae bacterium]|nr:IS200/IS605 family transposase [Chitinophagaceae bacterium]